MPATAPRVIEVRVREMRQLFDAMDPSPFHEQDVVKSAEDYIVESAREMGGPPSALRLHVGGPVTPEEAETARLALQRHFARRARRHSREVRDLLRDGLMSLAIGLTFLVLFFALGQLVVRILGESPWSTLARESLLIGGWVAMWRPLEIFLYAWWPIARERRLIECIGLLPVEILPNAAAAR